MIVECVISLCLLRGLTGEMVFGKAFDTANVASAYAAAVEKSDGGDVERTDSLRAAKVDGRRSEGALNGPNPRMSAARM